MIDLTLGEKPHVEMNEPESKYIVNDFKKSRLIYNDETIGGMIVCDSQAQARNVFSDLADYDLSKALILYNEDDKKTRSEEVDNFKKGKIDILVVQNMLLTGFDAPRLKKIYLGRVIKAHNLLQTLTRVNRPYKNFKYGYVVDFADIEAIIPPSFLSLSNSVCKVIVPSPVTLPLLVLIVKLPLNPSSDNLVEVVGIFLLLSYRVLDGSL